MKRFLFGVAAILALAVQASAHFVFVVPENDGKAKVVMSETLKPDEEVGVEIIAELKLSVRDAKGADTELKLEQGKNALDMVVAGSGTRVIHGKVDLGINERGGKANVLIYYPKTILGNAFAKETVIGESAAAELVPVGLPGKLQFKLLGRGKPVADSEIIVILPDGTEKKAKTDKDGLTEVFEQTGRFGAWARFWENTPGEREGKKYEQLRHYATLVATIPGAADATQPATAPANAASKFRLTLPEATSSFGSVVDAGYLYIYGGHIKPTHTYDTEAVSGKFSRLKLDGGENWETLAASTALQGMNLAAYGGKIYRIGGMEPRNKPKDPTDNFSIVDSQRFDPATGKWEKFTPLPTPRSSHDVVVIGSTLYVIGGWNLTGGETLEWCEEMLSIDLAAEKPAWKSIPQPFKRRALMAAAHNAKIYVVGGFDDDHNIISNVSIFDPATQKWSEGPALPGEDTAFGPAAATHNGKLYVSLGDGKLYVLNESAKSWDEVASGTPRIVHRLASDGKSVLILGGALKGKNFDLIEAATIK